MHCCGSIRADVHNIITMLSQYHELFFAHSYLEEERDSHGNVAEELPRVHDHAAHRAIVGFIAASKRTRHAHTSRFTNVVTSIFIPAFVTSGICRFTPNMEFGGCLHSAPRQQRLDCPGV